MFVKPNILERVQSLRHPSLRPLATHVKVFIRQAPAFVLKPPLACLNTAAVIEDISFKQIKKTRLAFTRMPQDILRTGCDIATGVAAL